MHTVIDCRAFPGDTFEGRQVIRTDEEISDFGTRWFESRAILFAERHSPLVPSYHLRVERVKGLWPRYTVKAFQNKMGELLR